MKGEGRTPATSPIPHLTPSTSSKLLSYPFLSHPMLEVSPSPPLAVPRKPTLWKDNQSQMPFLSQLSQGKVNISAASPTRSLG